MDGLALGLFPVLRTAQCQLALPALLRMLALVGASREELEGRIEAELARNPFLERAPGGPCLACGRHTRRGLCPSCRRGRPVAPAEPAARRSPIDALVEAVRAELPAPLRPLVGAVLGSLDHRGLATRSVDELAADLHCSAASVRRVIEAARAVGPPGIAAPTSFACLLEQARWLVEQRQAPAVTISIVAEHLAEVARDELASIAAMTGEPVETVIVAVGIIRSRMRPWITWGADASPEHPPAPPDVIVHSDPDASRGLRVEVTDASWFGVRLVGFAPSCDAGIARRWAEPWQHQARSFLHQIETRTGALRAVAAAIVEAQHEYLSGRRAVPCSLTRTTIASECALSISTVSRAVQGKHVRLPDGRVMPLSTLFDPSVTARHAVGQMLQRCPGLTDSEVSRRLAADGLVVARRTVTKYRAQLGIAASRRAADREAIFA